jgi:hypothetical protein
MSKDSILINQVFLHESTWVDIKIPTWKEKNHIVIKFMSSLKTCKIGLVWWCTPVIPDGQEGEVGRLQSDAGSRQKPT